jgi:tetratricopeptide (TPR) repeat protein
MFHRVTSVCAFLVFSFLTVRSCAQNQACGPAEYDCALFYAQHHDFPNATALLEKLLQQNPQDLKALNLLGIVLTGSNQINKANGSFQQALSVSPQFVPARKNLAINLFNGNQRTEAAREFNQVLKFAPHDPVAHVYLAEIAYEQKDLSTALKHYEQGSERVSVNPAWVLHYAECILSKQNNPAKAAALLKTLPEHSAEERFQAGLLLGRFNVYSESAKLFASARQGYRDPYAAGYDELLMLIKAGSYLQAIETFQDLAAKGYKTAELYNLISEAYLKTHRVQEAYDAMRTGTQIEPEAEDNYLDLAALCLENEEYSLGTDILNVGLHYVPNSYRLHIQRGVTFVMRGSIEEAEKDFESASSIAPEQSLPYLALSWVWIEAGQTEKAVKVLREKSKLPQMDYLVSYAFGVALVRSGVESGSAAGDEAVEAFATSIRKNGNFSHSHAELGKLLFKRGELDRAIAELKAAMSLDANDAAPVYLLAQAYRKKGQQAEASEMLARVSQLHSGEHNQDLKKELIRLVRRGTSSSPALENP